MTWSMSWQHTSLLCGCAVHGVPHTRTTGTTTFVGFSLVFLRGLQVLSVTTELCDVTPTTSAPYIATTGVLLLLQKLIYIIDLLIHTTKPTYVIILKLFFIKTIFLHTICNNSDIFRFVLIILREFLNIFETCKNTDGLLNTLKFFRKNKYDMF
jgi:hypothetical protein